MPRALSIYLPRWPIWLARRRNRARPSNPVRPERTAWLLVAAERGTQQVAACCERSSAAGVRVGMTPAHARSLLAGMNIEERPFAPHDDATALRRLARGMSRFAPVITTEAPDGLAMDIAGCELAFGGEQRHVRRIAEALRGWGLRPRMAVAPTFAGAWAVARYGEGEMVWIAEDAIHEALSPLPVRALRIGARDLEAMADVGVERIEHLFALPREELAARFGTPLLRRLDQAMGAAPETIEPIRLDRTFESAHDFDGPVRRVEIIEATTRELLSRLVAQLREADRGLLAWSIELRRVDTGPETLTMRLTYPTRDAAHLWKLLLPGLQRMNLGFGVEGITLRGTRTARTLPRQSAFLREMSPGADQPTALGELVDRLNDRLGVGAVTQVRPAETYVPEAAFVHEAVREIAATATRAPPARRAVREIDRPSQLFDVPEPARIMALVPDGPPAWVHWRGQAGNVVRSIGPERLMFPWWTPRAIGPRDYYEVEDEHGRRVWVYRDDVSGHWFVHGQWV